MCPEQDKINYTHGFYNLYPYHEKYWGEDISMDFIKSLPKSEEKDVILVVVDRLTKYTHFLSLQHSSMVKEVARAFLASVYRLHGCPKSIVSDGDKTFTSQFWTELFTLMSTKLHMSTAYHPQIDGQTERLNRCLETYQRCLFFQYSRKWHYWLAQAKWWYNTTFYSSIGMAPYEALYGQPPPNPLLANVGAVTS